VRDRLLEACDDFLKLRNAFPEPHDTLISDGGPSVVDLRAVRANALVGMPSPQPTGPSAHRNALNKYRQGWPLRIASRLQRLVLDPRWRVLSS
jgi:hypothetical protein